LLRFFSREETFEIMSYSYNGNDASLSKANQSSTLKNFEKAMDE